MVYVTGDIHSDVVKRFSKKNHPELRDLTVLDTVIVAGDFGCPWYNKEIKYYDYWTRPGAEKEELYKLRFLNNQPWTTIVVCGNHENYDLIEQMPQVTLFGAAVRQCYYEGELFENIFYVDVPQIMMIENKKCLLIPGAESHDAQYIFEWDDPETKKIVKHFNKQFRKTGDCPDYRIKNFSWWPQEIVKEESLAAMISFPVPVDYIISHDCPGIVHSSWKPQGAPGRLKPTKSEEILDKVRQQVDYKLWIHGHLHENFHCMAAKSRCIYKSIEDIDSIVDSFNRYKEEYIQM